MISWQTIFFLHVGGSVLHADCCSEPGSADSVIHELGHNLGLWHVHEGVSGMDCSDECYEKEPSLGKTPLKLSNTHNIRNNLYDGT